MILTMMKKKKRLTHYFVETDGILKEWMNMQTRYPKFSRRYALGTLQDYLNRIYDEYKDTYTPIDHFQSVINGLREYDTYPNEDLSCIDTEYLDIHYQAKIVILSMHYKANL